MTKIRLWTLGNIEHKIYPSLAVTQKLANILKKARENPDEPLDIIWGPDLSVEVVEGDMDVIISKLEDGNQRIQIIDRE